MEFCTPPPYAIEFQELIYDFFLQQVNFFPTRFNNILDLVLTNNSECVIDLSCTSPTSVDMFSDHKLLFFDFQVHAKLSPRECRTVFHYCQADWKNLHNDLSIGLLSILPENIDNDSSHSTTVDINIVWQHWRNSLLNAATRHIPTKVVKRRNTPSWFDNETCHSSKRKETARRKAKRTSKP